MTAHHVLVVDDEIGIRELLRDILEDEGYHVLLAENAAQARDHRQHARPDLVLLDIWMPDCDGVTLLKEWSSGGFLNMPVVMMSGHGTVDTAVEATRIGAYDFLEKPIALQKLLKTVTAALRHGERQPRQSMNLISLGKSVPIVELRQRLEQAARQPGPLLLVGSKGCGAEQCARSIHKPDSPWHMLIQPAQLAEAPIVLLEHHREGVIFIPEIADLDRMQQKGLLIMLKNADKHGVRVICATSCNLPQRVMDGQFDEALLQAVSGMTIRIPSLNDHREDIPDLVRALLIQLSESNEVPYREIDTAALNGLRNAQWAGGLDQLKDTVKQLALTCLEDEIGLKDVERVLKEFDHLEPQAAATIGATLPVSLDQPLREARDAFERLYFEHHIAKAGGNMSKVAEAVELERTHLYRKLKQLGIGKNS